MSPGTVAVLTTAQVGPTFSDEVPARIEYDATHPLEVRVVFDPDHDTPIEWVFARDLPALGLYAPAGLGDVRFEPDGEHVLMHISSREDGATSLRLPKAPVATFVESMLGLVPPGEEVLDFDEELARLLDGAR